MTKRLLRLVMISWLLVSLNVIASPWTVTVSEKDGLPAFGKGGAPAMAASYAFWAANWKWSDQRTAFTIIAPFDYSVAGKNQLLDFDLSARITRPSDRQLSWSFDLNAHSTVIDAIGGGIVFKFDLGNFAPEMGEPELLPGNQGWSWGRQGQGRIEMRFDPPLPSVYFERGRKDEIRAIFYNGGVVAGARRYKALVNVSEGTKVLPTRSEQFGPVDFANWQTDAVDWSTAPIDLSFLNFAEKPAGKRGFLAAEMDQLVFADGTTARFWGTNLTAAALFGTSKENVARQARRLSELGFNLVRLHHHDSYWVSPNIFGDSKVSDTRTLNPAMLDKLDWWIKCLKDEGIYVWLDLHVQRSLKPGDQIEGLNEIMKGKAVADFKGFNYVNASIQQAMKRFNEAYVNHRNPYTGLRHADEPAIAAMLITNENDLTHHFGNSLLPDKNVPHHNALYMTRANAFAATWGLPKDKTWRSWEHGPAKLFLNDLEQQFGKEMIAHLRAQGVRVPIVTTSSWGLDPLSALPALSIGDMIDAHSYGGVGELEKNPIYAPNLIDWIAAAQVANKPLTVTEWNVEEFPAPDRHAIPLYVAGSASLQGWDSLMQYAYAQVPLNNQGGPSNWHAFNDPALISTLPAAALLYRQGHVQEATTIYAFAPSREQLFNQLISPANSTALRTAVEKGKLVIALPLTKELPWLKKSRVPEYANMVTDPNQLLLEREASESVSDTGELRRNWEQGVYTIDTPRTQAAMGWIGGRRIKLRDIELAATTKNATVAVQSLDGKPIAMSKQLMISLGARAALKVGNQLPFSSEPVEGQLSVVAPKGLKLYKKIAASGGLSQVVAPYKDGRYMITLDRSLRTYWLFLR